MKSHFLYILRNLTLTFGLLGAAAVSMAQGADTLVVYNAQHASLTQAFSNGNGYFLTKPLQDADLDRVLESIATHAAGPLTGRPSFQ